MPDSREFDLFDHAVHAADRGQLLVALTTVRHDSWAFAVKTAGADVRARLDDLGYLEKILAQRTVPPTRRSKVIEAQATILETLRDHAGGAAKA